MLESFKSNVFDYQKLSSEEQQKRGILGRLKGILADFKNPTRNGRLYSEKLWENVFENPIMKEKIKNKCCFGELGHPADRTETDMEKVAVCLSELPKKGSDGKLYGVLDILDTPNGRILKTLCDYGCQIGISSRGQGEVLGDDSVDPDSYEFECFDAVLIPAVESARPTYVTESLDTKMTLTEALNKQIANASDKDKEVMKETLNNLDIKIECNDESHADKLDESKVSTELETKDEEANNVGSDQLVESLQEAIKAKSDLEAKVQSLQGELAVSNTKVDELNEELNSYKANASRLSTMVTEGKEEAKKVSMLEAKLNEKEETIKSLESQVNELTSSKESSEKNLNESISSKTTEVTTLNESLTKLQEQLDSIKKEYESKINDLTESFTKKEDELNSSIKDLNQKLADSNSLAEGYKKTATSIVSSYIEEKARMLDVKKEEIINKLPKKYTLKDVNAICESLKKYKLNRSKLPFTLGESIEKVAITESSDDIIKVKNPLIDDEVDDMLLNLVHKNK